MLKVIQNLTWKNGNHIVIFKKHQIWIFDQNQKKFSKEQKSSFTPDSLEKNLEKCHIEWDTDFQMGSKGVLYFFLAELWSVTALGKQTAGSCKHYRHCVSHAGLLSLCRKDILGQVFVWGVVSPGHGRRFRATWNLLTPPMRQPKMSPKIALCPLGKQYIASGGEPEI